MIAHDTTTHVQYTALPTATRDRTGTRSGRGSRMARGWLDADPGCDGVTRLFTVRDGVLEIALKKSGALGSACACTANAT